MVSEQFDMSATEQGGFVPPAALLGIMIGALTLGGLNANKFLPQGGATPAKSADQKPSSGGHAIR